MQRCGAHSSPPATLPRCCATAAAPPHRLDKPRFFLVGVGLFSGVTTALFPLSVIKTRQMAAAAVPAGLSGTRFIAQQIWSHEGLKGFYRGFGTVVFGTIPGAAAAGAGQQQTL